MPIRDEAAMDASLDNDYGSTAGPHAPASLELCLFVGDPMVDEADGGGFEMPAETTLEDDSVVSNGYARATIAASDWDPASGGLKQTAAPVSFTATAEWPDEADHFALYDPATDTWWDCAPLTEPLTVTGAGPIEVTPVVFYGDSVEVDE